MNKTKENKCSCCEHEIEDNENMYVHCPTCLEELEYLKKVGGKGFKKYRENTPRTYSRLEFAITPIGFQLTCVRHDKVVYDFKISEYLQHMENVSKQMENPN